MYAQTLESNEENNVRETRRLKGLYILTEEDAQKGATFDDTIGWRSGYLDLMGYKYTQMVIHDVPYRALLPEKVDGLLTAGRSISATHVGMAAGKSMGNCVATGHAAGLAAALSVQKGLIISSIFSVFFKSKSAFESSFEISLHNSKKFFFNSLILTIFSIRNNILKGF